MGGYEFIDFIKVRISCHNVDSIMNFYQLRFVLVISTSLESSANQGS